MDSSDDVTYLNYLNDKSHNFLLRSSDDDLCVQDPTLNGEPIFGDLDDGNHTWTIGGLPVLLNAPIISDDIPVESPIGLESQKILHELEQNEDSPVSNIENSEALTYPIEIPGGGFITSNGLFLSNDVLLQLSLQNVDHSVSEEYNPDLQDKHIDSENSAEKMYEIDYRPEGNLTVECNSNTKINETANLCGDNQNQMIDINNLTANTNEIIQLLNVDGTIININKDMLNRTVPASSVNDSSMEKCPDEFHELIETIVAYKCKKCALIFETTLAITKHIKEKHCSQKETDTSSAELNSLKTNGSVAKMKSILNVNQANKGPNQLVYLCSECDLGYSSTSELRNHMISEHKLTNGCKSKQEELNKNDASKPQDCSVKQKYISIVKKQQKASKKVKCSIKGCESRFASDDYRVTHEKCHINGQKKQFKCPTCEKTFTMWRVCSLHLWRCHSIDIGLLTCTVCSLYKTCSPHNLVVHMSIHDDARQYLCNECGKGFKQLTQLRNHQVLHLGHKQGVPPWLSQQKCDLCGNFFADSKTLKKHIQGVHNKFKPYVCNICGHKCARKAMLDLHLRQHTGEKPYKCPLCSYSTGDHNSLRRHRMRHNGDTKYSCPHCDYQSIQTVAYKKHITTKHPGLHGFFCCLYCSFQTVNENIYTTHFKTHQKTLTKTNESTKTLDKNICSSAEETVSSDGTQVKKKISPMEVDDEETQHGFLSSLHTDETVDTGGITIPAGLEASVS